MLDSWGKIPEGILSGHVNALGDFQQCIGVKVTEPHTFEGQYCNTYLVEYDKAMKDAKTRINWTKSSGDIVQHNSKYETVANRVVSS